MVASKLSIATRKEIKVLKKPLASWTPLVAMISVPICARIDPLDRIGPVSSWSRQLAEKRIRVAAGAPFETAPIINWPVCPW